MRFELQPCKELVLIFKGQHTRLGRFIKYHDGWHFEIEEDYAVMCPLSLSEMETITRDLKLL